MEKTKKKKPGTNAFVAFFKDYFSTLSPRVIATVLMFVASIVLLIGLLIPHEATVLAGLIIYIVATVVALFGCIYALLHNHKRSPTFKNAIINLVIVAIGFAIALTALIFTLTNGMFV